jgi:hypothetical protein
MAGKVRRDARGRRLKGERLAAGIGMLTIAAQLGVGSGTVQRGKRELAA